MTSTKQFGGQKIAMMRMRMLGQLETTPPTIRTIVGHLMAQKKPHLGAAKTRSWFFLAEKPDQALQMQDPDQIHTELQHHIRLRMLKLLSNHQQMLANRQPGRIIQRLKQTI